MKSRVKYKVKPTSKQAKAVEYLDNNGGSVGAAMIAVGYSKATAKNPSKLTKSRAIQSLAEANGVTIEQYMMNIGQAMIADKQNQFTGEITPDYALRLSANKQAREFLNLEEKDNPTNPNLLEALKDNVDELELTKLILRKS